MLPLTPPQKDEGVLEYDAHLRAQWLDADSAAIEPLRRTELEGAS